MKGHTTRHDANLKRLARVEGQIRGIQRMVEDGEYCIDIITQVQAAQSALGAVGLKILRSHVEHCVTDAMRSGSEDEAQAKTDELMTLMERYFKR